MNTRRMNIVGTVITASLLWGNHTVYLYATEAPLPYGYPIYQAYEKGNPQEAQALLHKVIEKDCAAAILPITADTPRIDVESRLGIGLTANVARHALTLHKKHAARVPVNNEVIIDVRSLLTVVDQVIANASARAETDERLRKILEFATVQKEKLLEVALDTMKAQGMQEALQATLAANKVFMERRKIDPGRWEAANAKKGGAQPTPAGDVLKAAPEK